MKVANDFKHSIGFKGTLLLEPKPQEPTKHINSTFLRTSKAAKIGFLANPHTSRIMQTDCRVYSCCSQTAVS
jgi:xylose isomerase